MLNSQPQLDLVFQALSDPTRRAIVERLGWSRLSGERDLSMHALSREGLIEQAELLAGGRRAISSGT
jgi:DNA-binding transcriptional ArsR family regulator